MLKRSLLTVSLWQLARKKKKKKKKIFPSSFSCTRLDTHYSYYTDTRLWGDKVHLQFPRTFAEMSASVRKGSDSFLMLHTQSGGRGGETGLIGIRCNFGNCFGSWWLTIRKAQAERLPRKTSAATRWAAWRNNISWPLRMKVIGADQLLQLLGGETAQRPRAGEASRVIIVQRHNDNVVGCMMESGAGSPTVKRTLSLIFYLRIQVFISALAFISHENVWASNWESDCMRLNQPYCCVWNAVSTIDIIKSNNTLSGRDISLGWRCRIFYSFCHLDLTGLCGTSVLCWKLVAGLCQRTPKLKQMLATVALLAQRREALRRGTRERA